MTDLSRLIDLLASLMETVSERRALLRQALGMKSPLLNAITWEGAPREFTVNLLAVLARDPDALDALIDITKEQVGGDVANEIDRLRPALDAWVSAGADVSEVLPAVPEGEKHSVFISYARRDGRDFAAALRAELAPRYTVWQDVVALQGGEDWWEQIKAAIDGTHTLILVITERALLSHTVRREWVYARRLGKQIVPVVWDEALLTGAPRWLQQSHIYILDPNHPDYADQHAQFLKQLAHPRPQPPVLNQTPPLQDTFVARPKLQELILDRLIGASRGEPQRGVTVLLGAGGFGKTTLAQSIGGDPDVTDVFSGGVYYLTVGETEQMLTQGLNAILRDLKLPEASGDNAAANVREALLERDCLLIIDDVWHKTAIAGLLPLPDAQVLITTRDPSVAALSTGKPIAIAEMESGEAAAVLTKYLPREIEPTGDDEQTLRRLASRLGEWPLLLNIFGGVLREEVVVRSQTLSTALAFVNEGLDTEGLSAFDSKSEASRNAALSASMAVGLRGFTQVECTRLYELAIFPDDVVVSEAAALALWHGTSRMSAFEGKKLLRRFSGGFTIPEAGGAFRLHDKLKEYLGSRLGKEVLRIAHRRLIAAWGDPHALSDEYAWNWIGYHLIEAGQADTLRTLLLDYSFLQAKLNATDVNALISDCDLLPHDATIRLIKSALNLSAPILDDDKSAVAHQLYGRLYSHRDQPAIAALRMQTIPITLIPMYEPSHIQSGGHLLRTLVGHTDLILGALELQDGRLLSCSLDKTLRLWGANGTALTTLAGHTDGVWGALELQDGRLLSWSGDETLRLWEDDGTALTMLKGHSRFVEGAMELSDGRLLSWSLDKMLRLWGTDGTPLAVLEGHTGSVKGATELRDGRLLSWTWGKMLRLWRTDGSPLAVLEGHTGSVDGALELKDGRLLSWSEDKTLWLWGTDGTSLAVLEGHTGHIKGALELRDGRLLSWSEDKTLRLWGADRTSTAVLKGHTLYINGALELRDGQLLSWSNDNTLRLWNADGTPLAVLEGHTEDVRSAMELRDGRLLSWSNDNTLRLWNADGTPLAVLEGHTEHVRGAMELRDERLLSWSGDKTLRLWNTSPLPQADGARGRSGARLVVSERHTDRVYGALELRDGRLLSWAGDATLRLWSANGTPLTVLDGHTSGVYGALELRDGRLLSWSVDSTLRLWGADGTPLAMLEGHTSGVSGALELRDGRLLSWNRNLRRYPLDKTLRLWNADGTALAVLEGHTNSVNGAMVLSDGRLLSWSDDTTLRLWNADGTALAVLEGHTNSVNGAMELGDGRLLSWSGSPYGESSDNTLRLWYVDGCTLTVLEGHTRPVLGAATLADGRLLSWSADGTLCLWTADGHFIDATASDVEPAVTREWFARWDADWESFAQQWDEYSVSADQTYLAWRTRNALHLCRFQTGERFASFYADSDITTAVFLQHGQVVALGCENGQVIFLKVNV